MTTPIDDAHDFPAAHSMDTHWWAVDAAGRVAYFNTGEAGAAPANTAPGFDLLERLADNNYGGLTFYADDLFSKADGKLYARPFHTAWNDTTERLPEPTDHWAIGYLLWLRDEHVIENMAPGQSGSVGLLGRISRWFRQEGDLARETPAPSRLPTPGKVVVWLEYFASRERMVSRIQSLLKSGEALRAWEYQRPIDLERFGIYSYKLDSFDNWICGPFERDSAAPKRPLTIEQLPADLAESIAACRLPDADFRRDALLQPFEHVESYTWDETWISTTGRPGSREAENPRPAETPDLPALSPTGRTGLTSLLVGALLAEPGANAVLNDYLADQGWAPLADAATLPARLEEVLLRFFTPEELLALEADAVEHLAELHPSPAEEAQAIAGVVATTRGFLAGQKSTADLQGAAYAAMNAWRDDFDGDASEAPPVNRVAWAAFALGRRWALVPMRTARAIAPVEIAWQVDRVLRALENKYPG